MTMRESRQLCERMIAKFGQCNCQDCIAGRARIQQHQPPPPADLFAPPVAVRDAICESKEETTTPKSPAPLNPEEKRVYFGRDDGISKVAFHGWTIKDAPGVFMMIHKGQLNIDHRYQRDNVSNARVLRICQQFSYVAFGVLIVGLRPDGSLWVIDGQHRKLAADKRDDIQDVPCLVFETESIAKEAGGFANSNSVRGPMKAWQLFRAQLQAEDPACLAVSAMVEKVGLRIDGYKSPGTVIFVAKLTSQYRINSVTAEKMLRLAKQICDGESIHGDLYAALCYYENYLIKNELGSLSNPEHVKRLVAAGQTKLLHKMRESLAYHGKSGAKIASDGIAKIINHNRKTKHLPSPVADATADDDSEG